jgi:LuxR family transcriptional regulator, maltose regulon positive regulatory protein
VVALVHAASAVAAAHRGQADVASHDAAEAERLLDCLAPFMPWHVAETGVWLARARMRLTDLAAAHRHIERAHRASRELGAPDVLTQWLDEAERRARAFSGGRAPALTPAELRVLQFLPSHRSFRQIGEQLFVSPNTVKTQALAVYRKLDVGSRSDAVARAQELDLLNA